MADVPEVLAKSAPNVLATYDAILEYAATLGPYQADAKKTSIHLVRETGFAGVHPRKAHLILNVRLRRALPDGSRWKSEQVSKNRWHHETRLESPDDLDGEVRALLEEAYGLG
jgi:hypothetical protein